MADHHENDELLDRAIAPLRELPPLDEAAVARIVTSAARIRELDADPHVDDLLPPPRTQMMRWPAVAGIAAAAAVAGYLLRGGGERDRSPRITSVNTVTAPVLSDASRGHAAPATARVPAAQASAPAADAMSIPTQFVFESRRAKRVALVGDFNGWDDRAAPLERESGSSLWSITVPLLPGRHVYAFLVDSVWTTDPRAPKSRDPDFGVTGSVVIVGKP